MSVCNLRTEGEANPCVGVSSCQRLVNGSLALYNTNDTCTLAQFQPCQDQCQHASCQFVKYRHGPTLFDGKIFHAWS